MAIDKLMPILIPRIGVDEQQFNWILLQQYGNFGNDILEIQCSNFGQLRIIIIVCI